MSKKKLKVSAIRNGTVIDHIRPGKAFSVVKILHLDETDETVTITSRVASKVSGTKDIVKIEDRELLTEEVSSIALISPEATVNIIKEYEVIDKRNVRLPDTIENILPCSNPVCITNHEPVVTVFRVERSRPIVLRCHYCERTMQEKDVVKVLG
ncbi:aspartate carbamoyltransferase regulatory subunit [archaeon]|nr:MAG: aspartate carbamoyltransferase regulatory subunit [archaeon]